MQLGNRNVIITGSGSGIGRAIAIEFARRGALVVCAGRKATRLDETVRMIGRYGGRSLAVPTDITDHGQVKKLTKTTIDHFGPIDVLFNNAGSFQSIAPVTELDPQTWWHDVIVNLRGAMLCMREILPLMTQRDQGVVINMDGGRPVGGTGYACGKAGLMELTRITAEELRMQASNVIILGAAPGLVRTEMTELQVNTEAGRKWIPSTAECFASGNLRQPREIAIATVKALELATPEHSGKHFGPDTDFSDW
jgi:NAD(P)-dependent dehydrogenase (short-subunit alcohol dehydrogenase family)